MTIRRHNPEDLDLNLRRRGKLKARKDVCSFSSIRIGLFGLLSMCLDLTIWIHTFRLLLFKCDPSSYSLQRRLILLTCIRLFVYFLTKRN